MEMGKGILGVVAGLAVWMIVVSVAGLLLRAAWPEYVSVADAMKFTFSMKLARLFIGALATLATGLVTAVIARSRTAILIAGALLLLMFIPQHVMLWDKFPIWYHLTFLLSLVPLTYVGGSGVIAWVTGVRGSFS
jgi:hypothetical protein